jgi:hypothetical protein
MELFKITCVTCRARLSVRDASLIGQILACPRCAMMVHVTAPAGFVAPVKPTSEAGAAKAEVVSGAQDPAAHEIATATTPEPNFAAAPTALEASESTIRVRRQPSELAGVESQGVSPALASFDEAAAAVTELEPTAPAAAEAPSVALPPRTSGLTLKLAATIITGGLMGSAVVGGVLYLVKGKQQATETSDLAAVGTKEKATAAPAPEAKSPATADLRQADAAPKELARKEKAPKVEEKTAKETDDIPDPDDKSESPTVAIAEPTKPSEAIPPAPAPPVEEPAKPPVPETPPAAVPNKPKLSIDPLDVDPEGLDISRLTSGPPKDPIAESHLPPEPPPTTSVDPASNPQPAPPVAPAALQAVRRDQSDAPGAPAAAAPLLARKLPAVKFDKMPLCRVLDLATQVSGLPVSVSPEQLRLASISAATPASADLKAATITDLLEAALKPLRLHPLVEKDQIVLRRVGDDKPRPVDYPVDDLVAAGVSQDALAAAIQQLVAPESWQAKGGAGTLTSEAGKLHVEQLESVQYDILLLLERARVTLGLPTRSKYPKELITAGPHLAGVMERTSAPNTFTFTDYTPLREIFRYWQEEMQVAVLVDWPALAEERLWPSTRIGCSAANKPWADAMDAVLQPLGLAWRAVDRRTIEITTLEKVAREPQLEVYRIKPDASATPDSVNERIAKLQAAGEPVSGTAVVFEPQARLLLVRQPAAVQRQIVATMGDLLEVTPPAK